MLDSHINCTAGDFRRQVIGGAEKRIARLSGIVKSLPRLVQTFASAGWKPALLKEKEILRVKFKLFNQSSHCG